MFRDTDELSVFLRHEPGGTGGLASYESMLTLKVARDLPSSPHPQPVAARLRRARGIIIQGTWGSKLGR